jgi:hypothetical protein
VTGPHESGFEVRWLFFEDADSFEKVNQQLATVAAGWEPYDSRPNPEGGWILMVKRPKTA